MPWRLTDEQRELRERIRDFAVGTVRPRMLEVDETCDYPFDVHQALCSEGYIGLAIPEEYGGGGADSISFCAYIEELAKVSATASLMAAYVKLTALPIMLAGSDEQKRRFLPPLASGEQRPWRQQHRPRRGISCHQPSIVPARVKQRGHRILLSHLPEFCGWIERATPFGRHRYRIQRCLCHVTFSSPISSIAALCAGASRRPFWP